MKKRNAAILLGPVIVAMFIANTADAASPGSGSVSKVKRVLKWKGGPFNFGWEGSDLNSCSPTGPTPFICDHFKLKVALGDGARVSVKVVGSDASPKGGIAPAQGNDFDMFIYDPTGNLVGESVSSAGVESVDFKNRTRFRGKPYDVAVKPYAVLPGATYSATAKVLSIGS